jgi:hypothetical protein
MHSKAIRIANTVVYTMSLVATVLFMASSPPCLFTSIVNGIFVFACLTLLLLTELPCVKLPDTSEHKVRSLFGFMYTPFGRLLFTFYLALLLAGMGAYGTFTGVLVLVASGLDGYLYWKHPELCREIYKDIGSAPSLVETNRFPSPTLSPTIGIE